MVLGPSGSASGGPLNPSAGNPLDELLGDKDKGMVVGLVDSINQTPEGGNLLVTKEVKGAAQSLGDILTPSDLDGS
jgi:hypothetical protein